MPSTFFGIELAKRALTAQQIAAEIAGHNVANAATEGYSRQRALMAASDPWDMPALSSEVSAGQLGTGVEVRAIQRVQDPYLTERVRGLGTALSYLEVWSGGLSEVEALVCEPSEQGLAARLSAFWDAWHDLSLNPDDGAARVSVREAGAALVDLFHHLRMLLEEQRRALNEGIGRCAGEINRLAGELANLTHGIRASMAVGDQPNDLLDRREQVLLELARLAGARAKAGAHGGMVVTLGGRTLVQDEVVVPVGWCVTGGATQLRWGDDGSEVTVEGGKVGAMYAVRDELLPWVETALDGVAERLVVTVNEQHRRGYGLDGVSGRDFFVGTDAHNVALADCVVDSLTVIAAGLTGEPGDGRNAAAIGELRHLMVLGPDACYRDTVSALGARVRLAEDERETEEVLYGQVEQLREQVAGVSLDEEMADLMRYQLAYNAAARLLTVLDEMLERLILNTGIVGR